MNDDDRTARLEQIEAGKIPQDMTEAEARALTADERRQGVA